MSGKTYYIDPAAGDDANDGLSPSQPLRDYVSREFSSGDTVLFKRGSVIRGVLNCRNGESGVPVTYGAYGEGEKPVFLGSVAVGDPASWVEVSPSVWRYTGALASEVCNLVFNGGPTCGNLRWEVEDLRNAGEWHYTGIGLNNEERNRNKADDPEHTLYLYSPANPGEAYSSIECVLWGERHMARGQHDIVLKNLSFQNSGVHGFVAMGGWNITIRDCEFKFIGGAVWHRAQRIRFGNAVEFWDGAHNITVERCLFDKIYDSGVTHQGGETRNIPHHLYFRNNLFIDNGMSAYECREPSQEIYFEYNTSINAGGGFSMQGETPPRQSEIHPQPMGHHVFIWRVEPGTQPGPVYIRHNVFSEAPYGAAIYSIIDPVDERHFVIDNNVYWQTSGELLNHFNGRSFLPAEWSEYQKATGQDANSVIAEPPFRDATRGEYRLQPGSPFASVGVQE